jgi:TP901 family phage tail tape measure protein
VGTLATLVVNLVLNPAQFNAGLAAARASAGSTMTAMNALGGVAAVATAVGFAKAAGAALEWDDSMAGVRRTVELSNDELANADEIYGEIESDLLGLAKTIPISTQELAKMAETAGSLGVATDEISEFARVTSMLAEISDDLTPDATARAFGTLRTTMGLTEDELNNVASAIVKLGISGASTEAEILSMAERASGAFGSLDIPIEELLAWSAAMANVREFSEAGGTTLQRLGLMMQKEVGTGSQTTRKALDELGIAISGTAAGSDKLQAIATAAGMTEEAFVSLFEGDPNAGMAAFIEGLSVMDGAMRNALLRAAGFTDIRLTRGLNKIISAVDIGKEGNLSDALKDAREGIADESIFEEMATERFATVANQLEILGNYIQVFAIKVGKYLLPPILMLAQGGMVLIDVLDKLITAFPGLSAVLTPLIAGLSALLAIKFGARLLATLLPGSLTTGLGAAWGGVGAAILSGITAPLRGLAGALSGMIDSMTGPLVFRGRALGTAVGAAFRIAMLAAVVLLLPIIDQMLRDLFTKVDEIKAAVKDLETKATAVLQKPDATVMQDWETYIAMLEESQDYKAPTGISLMPFAEPLTKTADLVADHLSADAVNTAMINYGEQILKQTHLTQEEITGAIDLLWRSVAIAADRGNLEVENKLRSMIGYLSMRTEGVQNVMQELSNTEQLAQIHPGMFQVPMKVDVTGIEEGFAEARRAIAAGFGSVKKALQNPPQLIPIDQRIENTEMRLRKTIRNVRRAVEVNDPINAAYWTRAAAKAAQRVDTMKGTTSITANAVKRNFQKMGIDVAPVWDKMAQKAKGKSGEAKTTVVANANATANGVMAAFQGKTLFAEGAALIQTLSDGIVSGLGAAAEAAAKVAAAVAAPFAHGSPPKVGPLRYIDDDGANVVQQLSKGMLGQKPLALRTGMEVAGAFRPKWGAGLATGANAGKQSHFHIGTLIADDRGIDELDKRMGRRRKMKGRGQMRYKDVD